MRHSGIRFPRARCDECGDARAGAVAFFHRFGSSLNLYIHFHVCIIDGVFAPDPQDGVCLFAVDDLDVQDAEAVQAGFRHRILRAFVRSGLLDKNDRKSIPATAAGS